MEISIGSSDLSASSRNCRKTGDEWTYPLGSKLPAVRDLAAEAGVNPNTMQKALQILEQKGVVYSPSTAGRFVTEDRNFLEELKVQVIRDKLQELHLQMQEFGYSPEQIQAFFKLL